MVRIDPARLDTRLTLLPLYAAVAWVAGALVLAGKGEVRSAAGLWPVAHAVLLGVAGNAVAGAGLQLGVAALGAPPPYRSISRWGAVVGYNVSLVVMLTAALDEVQTLRRMTAIATAGALAAWALPLSLRILQGGGDRTARLALAAGLGGLIAAAAVGAARLNGLALPGGKAAHAALGLAGGLLPIVLGASRAIFPTLLGVPASRGFAWFGAAGIAAVILLAWMTPWMSDRDLWWRIWGSALLVVTIPAQIPLWRRRTGRQPALALAWICAWLCMVVAGGMMLVQGAEAVRQATFLLVVVALMTAVPATLLPIVAFVSWWRLRTRVPRGTQVPGVGLLQPERLRGVWLMFRLPAAAAWLALVWTPTGPPVLRLAVGLETAAALALLAAFLAPAFNASRFRRALHLDQSQ